MKKAKLEYLEKQREFFINVEGKIVNCIENGI